jgi:hypothetical protein
MAMPSEINKGRGCPACATYGFDPSAPSLMYPLVFDDLMKIGVVGEDTTRLDQHRRSGWQTVMTWPTETSVEPGPRR